MPTPFSRAFLQCVNEHSITSLRAGANRTKFTGIWMVVVNGRIFGRPYYFAERSWYNAFLQEQIGEIKCDKAIIKVKGIAPDDLDGIAPAVNEAYARKYNAKPHNRKWVDGLCDPERVKHTMEFLRPEN